MEKRKVCLTCGKYLIAFQKKYLHPETPCNGVLDYIEIEATISDEFMNKKFEELYGDPSINDYERLEEYESLIERDTSLIEKYEKLLNHPLIKFLLWLLRKNIGGKQWENRK